MSSRTRVILIISLLLFAFAAAFGYLLFAPLPENPLRFRLAGVQASSSDRDSAPVGFYNVTIENTTNVPVYIHLACLIPENGPRAGEPGEDHGTLLHVDGSPTGILVPPRSSIQGSVMVDAPSIASAEGGKMHINYFWDSKARNTFEEGYEKLRRCLPSSIRPNPDTEIFESAGHTATLESSAPTP